MEWLTALDVVHLPPTKEAAEVMIALLPGTNFGFVWYGGAYIDVIQKSSVGTYRCNGEWYRYTDRNINVWDYLTDKPTIEFGNVAEFVLTVNDFMESA